MLAALAALGTARCPPLAAQDAPPPARVRTEPERPLGGSLVVVVVVPRAPDSVTAVRGTLAGEPLHFVRDASGVFRSLGGVPLLRQPRDTAALEAVLERAGDAPPESVHVAVIARPRAAGAERLATAPQFAAPPDSALAARLRRERERMQEVGRRAHETPRLWQAAFLRPRPGRITSRFAAAREFNGELESRHLGVDIAAAPGAPVRAANRGVVALVADLYYSGRSVFLDHGAGLVTGYFHLSRTDVQPGDTVARGQVIGRVGATGRVTGPHLHWSATYGRVSVDPLDLLRLDPAALAGAAASVAPAAPAAPAAPPAPPASP